MLNGEANDYWSRMRTLEDQGGSEATFNNLLREILTPATHLSKRDSIEFFTIVLSLLELSARKADILREFAPLLMATIMRDDRQGLRQDHLSKAQIIHDLSNLELISDQYLFDLSSNKSQDLDARNAAMLCLWGRDTVETKIIVPHVREFLGEMIKIWEEEKLEEGYNFGICAMRCLYELREKDAKTIDLINQAVHSFKAATETDEAFFNMPSLSVSYKER